MFRGKLQTLFDAWNFPILDVRLLILYLLLYDVSYEGTYFSSNKFSIHLLFRFFVVYLYLMPNRWKELTGVLVYRICTDGSSRLNEKYVIFPFLFIFLIFIWKKILGIYYKINVFNGYVYVFFYVDYNDAFVIGTPIMWTKASHYK